VTNYTSGPIRIDIRGGSGFSIQPPGYGALLKPGKSTPLFAVIEYGWKPNVQGGRLVTSDGQTVTVEMDPWFLLDPGSGTCNDEEAPDYVCGVSATDADWNFEIADR
jgi:hypothetical protein